MRVTFFTKATVATVATVAYFDGCSGLSAPLLDGREDSYWYNEIYPDYEYYASYSNGVTDDPEHGNPSTDHDETIDSVLDSFGGVVVFEAEHGTMNSATASFATVSGGRYNMASDRAATVAGGLNNYAGGKASTISGGENNVIGPDGRSSTIGGGMNNTIVGDIATIAGGAYNWASEPGSSIGGGTHNKAFGEAATIIGGDENEASGAWSNIGGGRMNGVYGTASSVLGGESNMAYGDWSSIGGGSGNYASGSGSRVNGGYMNEALGSWSFVGGGQHNIALGYVSTVLGGYYNMASETGATVVGGQHNMAMGYASVAMGYNATAADANSAVLGFSSSGEACMSMGPGTVSICADNGFWVNGVEIEGKPPTVPVQEDHSEIIGEITALSVQVEELHVDAQMLANAASSAASTAEDIDSIINMLVEKNELAYKMATECSGMYCPIEDRDTCEEAAAYLEFPSTDSLSRNSESVVKGCSTKDDSVLLFNKNLESEADLRSDRYLLCKLCWY